MKVSPDLVSGIILDWSPENPRPMPWKETSDPYLIWLSEVILQQTQVRQGISYYLHFREKYPTITALAKASQDMVLRSWQGLGYNRRALLMHRAARLIVDHYGGKFPDTYEQIRSLPGVGDYTAAAVASFAFGERIAVLDSNVIRVVCRIFGIADDPFKVSGRKQLRHFLAQMIAGRDPAAFNQAMMDFGAVLCMARAPDCAVCPVSDYCIAFRNASVHSIPLRKPKPPRRHRYFHYLAISDGRHIQLHRRDGSDIWRGMYDFPLIETRSLRAPSRKKILHAAAGLGHDIAFDGPPVEMQQILTHQVIHCRFYPLTTQRRVRRRATHDGIFVRYRNLKNFALPKVVREYIEKNHLPFDKHPAKRSTT